MDSPWDAVNHVAARYTPNVGDQAVLGHDDAMTVNFWTQIDRRIIDCVWTVLFNLKCNLLLEAVKEATNVSIRAAGIDVRLCKVRGGGAGSAIGSLSTDANGRDEYE